MNAAYHRAWRAAHPEYRAREVERSRQRRALHGRGDRSAEYARQRERRALTRRLNAGDNGVVEANHPLLEVARTVALGHVRPDRRSLLFRPTFEDAVSEALVAIVAGEDPVPAVRRYLSVERAWLSRTAPLLDHVQLRPLHEHPGRGRTVGPGDAPGGARPHPRSRPVGHAEGHTCRPTAASVGSAPNAVAGASRSASAIAA
jgi:hypothetical protein